MRDLKFEWDEALAVRPGAQPRAATWTAVLVFPEPTTPSMDIAALKRANGLGGSAIRAGQRLKLPT